MKAHNISDSVDFERLVEDKEKSIPPTLRCPGEMFSRTFFLYPSCQQYTHSTH